MYIILRTADEHTCPDGRGGYTGETLVVNCDHLAMAFGHHEHTHVIMTTGQEVVVAETVEQVINSIRLVEEEQEYPLMEARDGHNHLLGG